MSAAVAIPPPNQMILSGDPILSLLQNITSGAITPESVGVVERLAALYERQQKATAEQDYARAFVALQSDVPRIKATSIIPDNNGNPRSTFAPYEKIMEQVQPLLVKHGFGVTFDAETTGERTVVKCTLMHAGGHSRSNTFSARLSPPPKSSAAQGDGATMTYAKRYALCAALNIVVDHDTDAAAPYDARNVDAPITASQAADIHARAKACGANTGKLLAWIGVKTFEEIPESWVERIDQQLTKKEGSE